MLRAVRYLSGAEVQLATLFSGAKLPPPMHFFNWIIRLPERYSRTRRCATRSEVARPCQLGRCGQPRATPRRGQAGR